MQIICNYPDTYNTGNPARFDCGGFPGNINCANEFVNGLTSSLAQRCEVYVPVVDTLVVYDPEGSVSLFDLGSFTIGFALITMCYFIGLPIRVVLRAFKDTTLV